MDYHVTLLENLQKSMPNESTASNEILSTNRENGGES